MTAELNKLANDPNYVVQFAVGDPVPKLIPQARDAGPRFSGVYFDKPKRYVMKSAHMSREDVRMFDVDSGRVILVSHHPGKDPYSALDPLGMSSGGNRHNVAGGEWESVCDVSSRGGGMRSFKIRPKAMSRHGRQFVKVGNDVILNVGKLGKFATMSMRNQFSVGKGDDDDTVYTCIADMMGRTVQLYNKKEELVAQMAKTTKALLMTAAFGSGSESSIDIAPGVDCSVILAAIFAMGQVGEHCTFTRPRLSLHVIYSMPLANFFLLYCFLRFLCIETVMGDVFNNYVADPLKGAVVDSAVDAAGLGGVVDEYSQMSNQARRQTGAFAKTARFMQNNFFK